MSQKHLVVGEFIWVKNITQFTKDSIPAGTRRPEDVPLWSYFGRDVPNHSRTKIGRIKFLTYFGSALSGMHLASGNIENFP